MSGVVAKRVSYISEYGAPFKTIILVVAKTIRGEQEIIPEWSTFLHKYITRNAKYKISALRFLLDGKNSFFIGIGKQRIQVLACAFRKYFFKVLGLRMFELPAAIIFLHGLVEGLAIQLYLQVAQPFDRFVVSNKIVVLCSEFF